MRFSTWFTIHLSNFGFSYKWDEWTADIDAEEGSSKKVFLRETIDREIRMSYLERIQKAFPEVYTPLFPERVDLEEWGPIESISLEIMG
jgi:nuclear cap-binding protein subunit 1